MANLLVDTDVFVDHIRGHRRLSSRGHKIYYSVVTRAELFAGGNEKAARSVLDGHTEIAVDRKVAERGGQIKRRTGIKLPDALIAATALEHALALVTRNFGDFQRVPRLRLRREV